MEIRHPPARSFWSVGRVVPWVAAAIATLTVASGLLPLRWFGFEDFHIARQRPPLDAPFIPNLGLHSASYMGGEALAANLRSRENRRPRTFTTDALGFRWTPEVRSGEPPSVVVIRGASFVWGGSLSDEETLPAELARQLGVNVYNGARFIDDEERPEDFDRLMSKLAIRPRHTVFVQLEQDGDVLSAYADSRLDRIGKSIAGSAYETLAPLAANAERSALTWMRLSPVIQLSVRARKAIQNGKILPNPYSRNASAYWTPGGARILFERASLERAETVLEDSVIRDRAAFIELWHHHMLRAGSRMIVLLLPDKVSVYGPETGIKAKNARYLDRLEKELTARGVRVVNGLTILRPYAGADLALDRLSFWRDDLHWTPLGVQRVASATAQILRNDPPRP
jgi:hypothetical protein